MSKEQGAENHENSIRIRIEKITELVHEGGYRMPHEIINQLIEGRDKPWLNIGLHKHPLLVHSFQDWLYSVNLGLGAIEPWMGSADESASFEKHTRTLFEVFVVQLARHGYEIDDKTKEEAFQAFLED